MKFIAVLTVLVLPLLYVWERVDVVQVGYHIEQLKARKIALEREHDLLRVRVSTLKAPDRLAKLATEKLGMLPPQQQQIRLVRLDPAVRPTSAPPPVLQVAQRTP